MIKVSSSILSSDFANLEKECNKMVDAGTDMLHIDVMDGIFVPNITIGVPVIKSLRNKVDSFFDVHLMISNPIRYINEFAEAGSDMITFHFESCSNVMETINKIRDAGVLVGLAVKPSTDIEDIFPFLMYVDVVLIMTVEPGFGGQSFNFHMLDKIRTLKKYIEHFNINVSIEVDGGINFETAIESVKVGAEILVSGSFLFSSDNPKRIIDDIKLCVPKQV